MVKDSQEYSHQLNIKVAHHKYSLSKYCNATSQKKIALI